MTRPDGLCRRDAPLPSPDVIAGRYRLDGRVGRGGMADVHLGHDLRLDRKVAIKRMHPELVSRPLAVERFRREAILLAAIDSPHVVAVHDHGDDRGVPYTVLRHVAGATLDRVVEHQRRLSVTRTVHLVAQVLDGLAALHDRRLVHRDVTPANVMIGRGDRVVLLDLGVALDPRRRRLTPVDERAGTPGFMAPEALVARDPDHRADLFGAGLLAIHALSGGPPLHGDGRAAVDHLPDAVPAGLRAVLAAATSPAVDARPASAAELRARLVAAVAT
ncbi:MAG: serine/threonine protein kinase [Kofleriaceae bacterium]|nr:serine/threonine protein kinase [Kofleriaceae bacterium]MCB9573625.1 serine/threonine protein kinase [Kofleriaceae bacterium]